MGLLGSLNCFSKKTSKNRRKKQKQRRGNDDGGEQQQSLASPLSFTGSSTSSKATSAMSTPRVSSSSSSKKQFATSLSTNLVKSPLTPPRDDDNNSIPTIDSTYNKYNSQFSLSDAGGTTGSHQQQSLASNYFTGADGGGNHVNNFWPMSPLSPFGAVTSPGHGEQLQLSLHRQQQQGVVKQQEEYTIIYAPSGVLGVVIDTPPSSSSSTNGNNDSSSNGRRMTSSNGGRPVVHAIKDTCPIRDEIHVGDILIAVDDIDVTAMTAVEVSRLISKKSNQERRKLTLIRSGNSIGGSGSSRLYDRRR